MDGGAWQASVHGVAESNITFMHWRRKWQPTPVFLPGESQGWESLLALGAKFCLMVTFPCWFQPHQRRNKPTDTPATVLSSLDT